jgi:hypothetical protein
MNKQLNQLIDQIKIIDNPFKNKMKLSKGLSEHRD